MSFMSLSIEGRVAISFASNVEPGPTPKDSRSPALPVTIISSTSAPPSLILRVFSPPKLV